MPAPLGYLNRGQGQTKAPDPSVAPLIRKAFDLYAAGRSGSEALAAELARLGRRSRSGKIISHKHITRLLNNPLLHGRHAYQADQ